MRTFICAIFMVLLAGCASTPEKNPKKASYQTNWLKDDLGEFPVLLRRP